MSNTALIANFNVSVWRFTCKIGCSLFAPFLFKSERVLPQVWIKTVLRCLSQLSGRYNVEIIFSTGPPGFPYVSGIHLFFHPCIHPPVSLYRQNRYMWNKEKKKGRKKKSQPFKRFHTARLMSNNDSSVTSVKAKMSPCLRCEKSNLPWTFHQDESKRATVI